MEVESRILFVVTFSAELRTSQVMPVVNCIVWRATPNLKVPATFSITQERIKTILVHSIYFEIQ